MRQEKLSRCSLDQPSGNRSSLANGRNGQKSSKIVLWSRPFQIASQFQGLTMYSSDVLFELICQVSDVMARLRKSSGGRASR